MQDFLEQVRDKLNIISDFLNRLQSTIGLSNSTDESIFGKINKLEETVDNIIIPKYFTETVIVTGDSFETTFSPFNGVCLNNEVTIYHPDGGTLIWEGIEFDNNIGTLIDANNDFDTWSIKIQYFYI